MFHRTEFGGMWCYHRPGFEAHLLTELQRQQQCSQFCDTLLKAEGVSVPAHSCVLSALSPHISSALSSTPSPPAGQSRHLEFRALGACTLLHLVRLLYSGEMVGEGENEKQQAICAAAKLGINGLVEVTKSKSRARGGGASPYVEVGVQTEECEEGQSRWRREVRSGSICLWKEMLSGGGRDMWTQTEEISSFPPAQSAASFQTIDMSVLHSSGQTDSHPFVPITLIYPPNGVQTVQVSSDVPTCLQETAGSTSVAGVAPPYTSVSPGLPHYSRQTEPQICWTDPQAGAGGDLTAAEEWEDRCIDQFEGNIPGFINYFLNSENKQGASRGRAARRQQGARRARTGQQRARRPRGRPAGRGRRGFTQTVDVQEIDVGKLQKMFLHRWGMKTPRTGRGGGAVGRKLSMKTREAPQPGRRCPRRRGRGKALEVSQSWDMQPWGEGRGRNTRRGRKNPPKQINQFYSGPLLPASSPSLPPSLSHNLLSPASSYASPASSLHHTTRLPPPAPPPPEDRSYHVNRFLEEFVMGLNVLPANSTSSSSENQQQVQVPDSEAPVLQQQCEGELNSILENFLQSFEQHVELCNIMEAERGSSENTVLHTLQLQHKHTPRLVRPSETSELHEASSSKHTENPETRTRKVKRRKAKQYLFSLEKMKRKRSRSLDDIQQQTDQQLLQIPVVKLQRKCLLPANVTLQGSKSQSREDERPSETKTGVSSAKNEYVKMKSYPIRSRIREGQIMDFVDLLVEPLSNKRTRKKASILSSISGQSSAVQALDSCHHEQQSERHQGDLMVQTCAGRGNKRGAESDEETTEDPAPNKRIQLDQLTACETSTLSSESEEYDDSPAVSAEQRARINLETVSLASLSDCFQQTKQEKEPNGETEERSAGEEMKNSDDEMISVEGDDEDTETLRPEKTPNGLSHVAEGTRSVPPSHPAKQIHLNRTGKCEEDTDEDVDVIGGSSPAPDPVVISWTESSDGEEGDRDEEVDVVGEKHGPHLTPVSKDSD